MQEKRLEELLASAVQLYNQGNFPQAYETVSSVLTSYPSHAKALNLKGLLSHMLGDTAAAIESIQKAITSDPTQAIFFANLSGILLSSGQVKPAVEASTRAVELDGENPLNVESLANAFLADNQYEAAHSALTKAIALNPRSVSSHTQGLNCARKVGDFHAAQTWLDRIAALFASQSGLQLPSTPSSDLISLAYTHVVSPLPQGIFEKITNELDRRYKPLAKDFQAPPHRANSIIKIGYLSQHFGDNPIGHVTHGIFKLHDRKRFEVHIFSLRERQSDHGPFSKAIKEGGDHYHNLSNLSPLGAAQVIKEVGVDALIYLDGFMTAFGPAIMAQRPAPKQYFWLGHAGTLGFSFIDATIADEVVWPSIEESNQGRVLRLDGCYHCISPQNSVDFVDRELHTQVTGWGTGPTTTAKPFVFCAFNNPEKIDKDVFDAWMQILRAVPESFLWLSNQFNVVALERNLRAAALEYGINGERLIFAGRLPSKQEHLGRHKQADLFLDTFTHTASTTALDALWMGVPIVTLRGNRFASRICADFLITLNMPELICSTKSAYVEAAIRLATNQAELSTIRDKLIQSVRTSPLFKPEKFMENFEAVIAKECC